MPSPASPASPTSLSERLQLVTEALAAARTGDEVVAVVLTPALEALAAVAGAMLLVDQTGTRLEIAATQGYEAGAQTLWQDGPLDGHVPAGDALERHEPLFFEQQGDLVRLYPELEARTGGVAAVATAVLPMFLDDRPLGAIILDFREPHEFTPEEKRFLRTLAAQCAVALGRVRSLERLRQEARQKTDILESISDAFYAVDRDWRFTYVNREAERLWGKKREDLLGQVYWEVFPQAVGSAPYQAHLQAAQEQRVVRLESRSPILNVWVDITIHPTPDGLSVYFKDITARKQAEEDIREFNCTLERRVEERTREAEAARSRAEVLAALGDALQAARSPEDVAALALKPLSEVLGASSAMVVRLEDGLIRVPTIWGEVLPAMAALQTRGVSLKEAPLLAECARTGEAGYYADDNAAGGGLAGLPTLAFAVEPIWGPESGVAGFLCVWRSPRPESWPEGERDLLRRTAGALGLALERAQAQREAQARTEQIEADARAREAFVALTEAVGTELDVITLAQRAVDVLQAHFAGGTGGYYERVGELWKLRSWTSDLNAQPEFLAALRAGLPSETPFISDLLRERAPVFTENWDAGHERIEDSGDYGTVAAYPVILGGEVRGFFTMGFKTTSRWAEQDRAIFRAVGHSLTLALERAEQARQLQAQNVELGARTRALEAFEEWSRDLTLDAEPSALIERAEELLLDLLPVQAALYYEREGERWFVRSMRGEYGSEGLRLAHEAGLAHDTTDNLRIPAETDETYYQDVYDHGTDGLADRMAHVSATAIVPLRTGRGLRGLIGLGRFGQTRWTGAERTIIETVRRSLELALDRAEAAHDLLTAQLRLRAVVNNAPVVLFALDGHGTFTLSEGRGLAGLGLEPGEAVGQSAFELYQGVPELLDDLRLALGGQEVHRTRRIAGRVFESWTIPVPGAAGTVPDVVGVSVDVTERQRAEEDLARRNEELRRSNAELEQFAYIASHDLQAPIRAVTSFAGVVDRRYGGQLDERGRLYLRQIVESGEHMKRLVDDLLTFSRVHTEQRPLRFTDAGAVFDAVLRRLSPETEALAASVTRAELPQVVADAQQVDQLLQNLIGNGLKYRREGVAPQVHVSAEREGRVWRFAVRDNGIGIEPQYFERIFVIFQRLHGREQYEGTGIGLAVCKKIVERHGGRLWLESCPGEGSTFFFTLPAA